MLRDLGRTDKSPVRTGEIDPNDSVFLVLLWYEKDDRTHFEVGGVFLGKGEALAAQTRYANEGSVVIPDFQYVTVLELQTGQLAPKGERHGDPVRHVAPDAPAPTESEQISALQVEINRLRAQLGSQTSTAEFKSA